MTKVPICQPVGMTLSTLNIALSVKISPYPENPVFQDLRRIGSPPEQFRNLGDEYGCVIRTGLVDGIPGLGPHEEGIVAEAVVKTLFRIGGITQVYKIFGQQPLDD